MYRIIVKTLALVLAGTSCFSQTVSKKAPAASSLAVIAYYDGPAERVDSFAAEKLTHIIFSFCHLKGNQLVVDKARDSVTIQKLVSLKQRNPGLKVMLSLGGWGGCSTCSEVFASATDRREFAISVNNLLNYFNADGIDLDWEYQVIPGYPGHRYSPDDKPNFTKLVIELRKALGNTKEISFAAGGFTRYLQESVEWHKVMNVVDRVNLMTYDLVHGYSTVTGHHTPLYPTPEQKESAQNAVRYLDSIGIPRNKLVIGAAFYARIFENVDSVNNGLFRPGRFKSGVGFKSFSTILVPDSGYVYHWDAVAQAPYMYNAGKKWFVTFDDAKSIWLKTNYAIDNKLNGIMFWQLADDTYENGLLDVIYDAKQKKKK